MDQSNEHLARAFETLADSAPDGASLKTELALMDSFRQHHVRRKRQRQAISLLTFCLCLITVALVVLKSRSLPVQPQMPILALQTPDKSTTANQSTSNRPLPENQTPNPRRNPTVVAKLNKPVRPRPRASSPSGDFVSLPSYDAAFSNGGFKIVRLGLTRTDLYQMGAPQVGDLAKGQILADVMLDRDGIPIAVRRIGK